MMVERWGTPASDLRGLSLVSLADTGEVVVVVEGTRESVREQVKFIFRAVLAYQRTLEEYRTALWAETPPSPGLGWTRRVVDSPWRATLCATEPLFLLNGGDAAEHYIICSEDHVVEVLAKEAPQTYLTSNGR